MEQNNFITKNKNLIIIFLLILLIGAISVSVWAIFFRGNDKTPISPDYAPQKEEVHQTPIEGDNSDKLESPVGGGAISITYSSEVVADLSDRTVTLFYANPNASNQNVSILIMIDDLVIAKSDLITPGHNVTTLTLEESAVSRLQEGGYNAELVIRSYHPETNEKAMVDAKGELTVTVQP